MAKIPQYTTGIVAPRRTPQMVDEGAIYRAGQIARGVAEVADIGAKISLANEIANETTAVNDALIEQRKQKLVFLDDARKKQSDNPFDFAKRIEPDLEKIDEMYAAKLPSNRARKAFYKSAKEQNLSFFQQNFSWQNTRSAQLYAERTEKAAQTINDSAFLAGQSGGNLREILNDVAATTVSVGSYQPDKTTMRKVNEKMTDSAVISYIRGMATSNPMAALTILKTGEYDKYIGAEKSSKLQQSLGEQAFAEVASNDPEEAIKLLDSGAFKGVIPANKIEKYRKTATRLKDDQESRINSMVTAKTAGVLLQASEGNITAADIEMNPDISDADKSIAKALLIGDTDTIQELSKRARRAKEGAEEIDFYTASDTMRGIVNRFNNTEKTNKDIKDALTELNSLRSAADIARSFNMNNRGEGINKSEYKALMKEVDSYATNFYKHADRNSPFLWNGTPFDYVFDEVKDLAEDKAVRSELLGYATAIAETQGIDLFAERSGSKIEQEIKPIIEELKFRRRKQLGIADSAPKTKTVIKNNKKVDTGIDTEAKADRSVNPKTKPVLLYNPKTGVIE